MIEYNPFAWESQHNPYPIWRILRDEAPVYHNAEVGFYALSRYEDVLNAALDPGTFSSAHGVTIEAVDQGQGFLIGLDPPEHRPMRKLLSRVFTPRRVTELEPFIRSVAVELLDPLVGRRDFDVFEEFSCRLPLAVISELLDIPAELRERVHDLTDRLARRSDENPNGISDDAMEAGIEMRMLLLELVADRRCRLGGDIVSMLIQSELTEEDGRIRRLDDEEIAAQFHLLAFAGHETVSRLFANGIVALAWYPHQRKELVDDPALLPNAVEEMLRWDNPAPLLGRWATREVTLHGVTIPPDSRIVLLMGSANHDERQYAEPELFDIRRSIERPLGFGFGIHLCLGAALARLELRVAFEEFLRRFPEFDLATEGIVRARMGSFRGLAKLPIEVPSRR